MNIGILSLQGDFQKHREICVLLKAPCIFVRQTEDLSLIDGLIIPGGESTTMGKLLERFSLLEPLRAKIREGLPVFGTCAGMIILARDLVRYEQPGLKLMDIAVERNAYGRQVESFEAPVQVPVLGKDPVNAVFIRAPRITDIGADVETLAVFEDRPVLVRQKNMLACSFHPELVGETRLHAYFLDMVTEAKAAS